MFLSIQACKCVSAANVYTGGATSDRQYDLEGTTTTTQTSFWHTSMTSQAMSAGNWSYAGSTLATYTINQDFQSTPTAKDINGGEDHFSKNMTWSMSTFGNSLTSISGSGSELYYKLTAQETATDNSSGTYHLNQSDGIIYDASLSGLA